MQKIRRRIGSGKEASCFVSLERQQLEDLITWQSEGGSRRSTEIGAFQLKVIVTVSREFWEGGVHVGGQWCSLIMMERWGPRMGCTLRWMLISRYSAPSRRQRGEPSLDSSEELVGPTTARVLRQLCVWAAHTEVVGELNLAVLHLIQRGTSTCGELGTWSSSVIDFTCRLPVRQWRIARQVWRNPPCGTSSGWWVIRPWRPAAVHEFTGRHEKAHGGDQFGE